MLANHRYQFVPLPNGTADLVLREFFAKAQFIGAYGCSDFNWFGDAADAVAATSEDLETAFTRLYPMPDQRELALAARDENWSVYLPKTT